MRLYDDINNYLVKRMPTIWNTHALWVLLGGILLHLIYFVVGYSLCSIDWMKEGNVGRIFFNTIYFTLYAITCLCIFIYFALRYFSHNPFRNFYPITKSYFWKVFGILTSICLVYGSVVFSFETGMRLKAKKIVPENALLQEIDQVNLAYPFFFSSMDRYHITLRSYPNPFPLENLTEVVTVYDSVNNQDIKHGIDKSKPFVLLNEKPYQFGKTRMIQVDSCTTKTEIDQIIDIRSIYGLSEYSLLNFSDVSINYNESEPIQFINKYAQKVHRLYTENKVKELEEVYGRVKAIAQKYFLECDFNAEKMATLAFQQNLDSQQLIRVNTSGFFQPINTSSSPHAMDVIEANGSADNNEGVSKKMISPNYLFDLQNFQQLVLNKYRLENNDGWLMKMSDKYWVLLFGSMCIAFLLVIAKYIPLRTLLTGIVVTGITTALSILFMYLMLQATENSNQKDQGQSMTPLLIILCATVVLGIRLIYSAGIRKQIGHTFLPTTVLAILILPTYILVFIQMATRIFTKNICTVDSWNWVERFQVKEYYVLALILLSLYFVFILLRKIQAKAE